MRRILVESARTKKRLKRGGDRVRQELAQAELATPAPRENLLALDEALTNLAAVDPPAAELVKLRYFAGLTLSEAARVLGLSQRSAERLWTYARAWLHEAIQDPPANG